jgi:hypothetical protein
VPARQYQVLGISFVVQVAVGGGAPDHETLSIHLKEAWVSRRLRVRSVLFGLLAGASVIAAAGCFSSPSNPVANVATNASASAEPLAPRVVAQALRLRTVNVKVELQVGGSGGRAELAGPVEYTAGGVNADLTGTITGEAVHLMVLGDTVYVAQLFQLPAGTTWLKMAAGGERASDSSYWVVIDQIVTGLTYVTDEGLLTGLAYNAAPAETIDSVSVRTALAVPERPKLLAKLKAPQQDRLDRIWPAITGARILVAISDDTVPYRLSMTPTGTGYSPTIELTYTGWGTNTATIDAPSGAGVRDYP